MIAVDTNLLVYAHREESPHHHPARDALRGLAESGSRWGVPWPCVHEFLAVVTHPRVYAPPSPMPLAVRAMRDLAGLPGARLLGESERHLAVLADLLESSGATGARVHDARVAAICLTHGVSELWTADRDFSYFPELRTRNPLVA